MSIIHVDIQNNNIIHREGGIEETTYKSLGLLEFDLEQFILKNPEVVFEDETLMIVGQQVLDRRYNRCDLVAVDVNGNLITVEIKRDAGDAVGRSEAFEMQAVRYTATLSTIDTKDKLVEDIFRPYLVNVKKLEAHEVETEILRLENFLGEVPDSKFNRQQRIVLIASSFDDECLGACAWLSKNGIEISAISLMPHVLTLADGSTTHLINVHKVIPIPVYGDYVTSLRHVDQAKKTPSPTAKRRKLPETKWMLEKGLIAPGQQIRLRFFEDVGYATIVDGRNVSYNGEILSYYAWGCKISGWTSINIYSYACVEDGKTLDEIRLGYIESHPDEWSISE